MQADSSSAGHKGNPRIVELGKSIPSPEDLPDPGVELWSPALQADSLPTELSGKHLEGRKIFKKLKLGALISSGR